MSDDLMIQGTNPQIQQKSPMPYVLGGAVLGAAAGAGGAYYTSPKYSSFDDLVAEAEDTFDNKMKEAAEEEKGLWEKAKAAREAKANANETWEKEFTAYKEANKGGVAEIDSKLVEAETNAQTALDAKRQAMETAEIKKLSDKNGVGELTEAQRKMNEGIQKEINGKKVTVDGYLKAREKAFNEVNAYIRNASNINYSVLDAAKETYIADVNNIDDIQKHLTDGNFKKGAKIKLADGSVIEFKPGEKIVEPPKMSKAEYDILSQAQKDARSAAQRKYNETIKQLQNAREALDKEFERDLKKVFATDFGQIQDPVLRRNTALNAVDSVLNLRHINENAKATEEFFVKNIDKYEEAKKLIKGNDVDLTKEKKLLEKKKAKLAKNQTYLEILRLEELTNKGTGTHKAKGLMGLAGVEYPNGTTSAEQKEIAQLKEILAKKKVTEEMTTEARKIGKSKAEKEVKRLSKEIPIVESSIESQVAVNTKRAKARAKVKAFEAELEKIGAKGGKAEVKTRTYWNGIRNVTETTLTIKNAEGKIVNITEAMTQRLQNMDVKLTIPTEGDETLRKLQESLKASEAKIQTPGTKLTQEQITTQARQNVEKLIADTDEQRILNDAKKAVNEAKANAPKVAEKADDVLLQEFAKTKNVANKEEFINNAVKDSKEGIKELFEKKWKFNGKTAAFIAGGALALAGLGYLMAPKNKQA